MAGLVTFPRRQAARNGVGRSPHTWDLPAVSRRLGHGSVAITATTYEHLLEDDERRRQRRDRLDGLHGAAGIAAV